jgi:hypothetical protein
VKLSVKRKDQEDNSVSALFMQDFEVEAREVVDAALER